MCCLPLDFENHITKKRPVSSAPLAGATAEADKKCSPDDVIHMLMDLSRVLERVEVIKRKNTWNSAILIHDI